MRRRSVVLVLAVLAAACHRDEPIADGKPLSYWKKEATQVSFMTFWNSDKDERRHVAFRRLSEIGEPAVPALVDLFRQGRIPVTGDAFNALANLGPRAAGAVPELLEIMNGDKAELRRHAAWILGTIGPAAEPAVPRLTPLLQHPDARLREAAAKALGQIGGSGRVALDRARTSDEARQREAALRGIAARPLDPASQRDFVASALADQSPEVRLRGVDLLMTLKGAEAEPLAEYLVKALNDPDPQVNRAAHTVLTVYLQHGGATSPLLAAVLRGGDTASRADVAWELGNRLGEPYRYRSLANDPAVVDALVGALGDADPKVRIYAGRALVHGDDRLSKRAIRTLRAELPKVEPILGVRAARVLWGVARNVDEVKSAYEAGLADPEKWHRVEAMAAIMDMGKDAEIFVKDLERLLRDPDPEVRDRAEKLLYFIKRRRSG